MFKKIIEALFFKRGQISKTAVFLSSASILVLLLYGFQSLFAGTKFFDWWIVPEFSAAAATAILGSLGALYAVNHGWASKDDSVDAEQLAKLREDFNSVVASIKGDSDAD